MTAAVLPPDVRRWRPRRWLRLRRARPGLPGQYRDVGADLARAGRRSRRAGVNARSFRPRIAPPGRAGHRGRDADAARSASSATSLTAERRSRRLVEALALAGRIDEAMAVGTALTARLSA